MVNVCRQSRQSCHLYCPVLALSLTSTHFVCISKSLKDNWTLSPCICVHKVNENPMFFPSFPFGGRFLFSEMHKSKKNAQIQCILLPHFDNFKPLKTQSNAIVLETSFMLFHRKTPHTLFTTRKLPSRFFSILTDSGFDLQKLSCHEHLCPSLFVSMERFGNRRT